MKMNKAILFLLLLSGCTESSYKIHDEVNTLIEGESALAFSHYKLAKDQSKAFEKLTVSQSLIDCLKEAERDWNPGIYDRHLVIQTLKSNVFIQFYFEKRKLKFIKRNYIRKGHTLIQSGGATFRVPCDASDLNVVDKLYDMNNAIKGQA